ncbi:unnamed protein product, partial [Phaeothamnion confervicola]
QVIPSITNTFGIPMMLLPLTFVVAVDAIFMVVEDIARHTADKKANSSRTRVFRRDKARFTAAHWSDLQVGDLVRIKNREAVPCDVLLVAVDEPRPESPAGICYVETKSLDGETNLKIRQVVRGLLGAIRSPADCTSLRGSVVMEHPNKLINNFKGNLRLDKGEGEAGALPAFFRVATIAITQSLALQTGGETRSEPIDPDNLLLRGCMLRNTRWALGLVLNTGADTKIMMSMSAAPVKASHLSDRINTEIKRVAALMVMLCIVGAAAATAWTVRYESKAWYLSLDGQSTAGLFVTQIFYFVLLLNGFIPISLYVSMNFVRFFQSWFMNQDLEMYHVENDTPARVRTMNLNEDLGQVSHIFSDKTGTLTCNEMDFRKCCIGGVPYGKGITEIGRAALLVAGKQVPEDVLRAEEISRSLAAPHVNFYDPQIYVDMAGDGAGGQRQADRIDQFFTALAVCHTVIPEKFEDASEVILSASSPDDEALVLGAKYFGCEFVDRVDSAAVVRKTRMTGPPPVPASASSQPRPGAAGRGRDNIESGGSGGSGGSRSSSVGGRGTSGGGSGNSGAGAGDFDGGDGGSRRVGETATPGLSPDVTPAGTPMHERAARQRALSDEIWSVAKREEYDVLHILGFTSDRKRMSVICRCPDDKIRVFTKGADTVMLPRLRVDTEGTAAEVASTVHHMNGFAQEGLRTLLIAVADVDGTAYAAWAERYEAVITDLAEIEKKNQPNRIEDVMDEIERGLVLLGSTAIEDKLQDGVPTTIADLMGAGIKVWVLTGDKEETAINIGVACRLIWAEDCMDRTIINLKGGGGGHEGDGGGGPIDVAGIEAVLNGKLADAIAQHDAFIRKTEALAAAGGAGGADDAEADDGPPMPFPRVLIMDGPALLEASASAPCMQALLKYAQVRYVRDREKVFFCTVCHSIVCCRVTPDQKRAMVGLVRHNVPGARTLAIGDGANDVPMIQAAHVGVGISGQEGMQAVNSSDYALAQFRFLRPLLLVHGRWNYRRSSRVVCYLFYKSVIFAAPLFFYAFFNGFSGMLFYDYVTTNLYAVVFTALPILLYGIYDQDIDRANCLRYPSIYSKGISDTWMTPQIFWSWMCQAILEGGFVTLAPLYFYTGSKGGDGVAASLYEQGTCTFTLVVLLVSMKMAWVQYRWTWVHIGVLLASLALFFSATYVVSLLPMLTWDYSGVMGHLLASANFWLVVILCLAVVLMRDLAWKFNHRWFQPALHHVILECE